MTERKRWPDHAEEQRLDAIALLLDVQHLARNVESAIKSRDYAEAVRLNTRAYTAAVAAQELLKEARRA